MNKVYYIVFCILFLEAVVWKQWVFAVHWSFYLPRTVFLLVHFHTSCYKLPTKSSQETKICFSQGSKFIWVGIVGLQNCETYIIDKRSWKCDILCITLEMNFGAIMSSCVLDNKCRISTATNLQMNTVFVLM